METSPCQQKPINLYTNLNFLAWRVLRMARPLYYSPYTAWPGSLQFELMTVLYYNTLQVEQERQGLTNASLMPGPHTFSVFQAWRLQGFSSQ
jgi:hypothetical protein